MSAGGSLRGRWGCWGSSRERRVCWGFFAWASGLRGFFAGASWLLGVLRVGVVSAGVLRGSVVSAGGSSRERRVCWGLFVSGFVRTLAPGAPSARVARSCDPRVLVVWPPVLGLLCAGVISRPRGVSFGGVGWFGGAERAVPDSRFVCAGRASRTFGVRLALGHLRWSASTLTRVATTWSMRSIFASSSSPMYPAFCAVISTARVSRALPRAV